MSLPAPPSESACYRVNSGGYTSHRVDARAALILFDELRCIGTPRILYDPPEPQQEPLFWPWPSLYEPVPVTP